MTYTFHYDSPLGGITIASNGTGITGLWFDGQKYFGLTLPEHYEEKELPIFEETRRWLDIYFSGREPDFTPLLSMEKTMTYGEIADKIAEKKGVARMSAQAVGGAVGHNAISLIIPCHRVVGANGSLTGYAGGIEKKQKLLAMEKQMFGKDEAENVTVQTEIKASDARY